jgi:myo-inositol 2-dehydrogenase / D-chiro-inositol 1-dehydrogenase
MTLAVGVIGAGIMGADHIATLHRSVKGAVVAAVADVDRPRARAAAATAPGAAVAADAASLIADPGVEAILVASHDSTHADLTIAAVQAGKPVLCEKPLAPTVSECDRVLEAERRQGRQLVSVGFMRRFDPAYVALRAARESGAYAAPLLVHCVTRTVGSATSTSSESSITGAAIHDFDTVPWLLGSPVTEVAWHAPRSSAAAPGLQDPQLLLLRTADGVLTTVEVFLNATYGYDLRCEIVCEQGTIALATPAAHVATDARLMHSVPHPLDWRPRFAEAYRLELQAWVDSLSAGRDTPLATGQDGLQATAVAEAAIASMHEGAPVAVRAPGR